MFLSMSAAFRVVFFCLACFCSISRFALACERNGRPIDTPAGKLSEFFFPAEGWVKSSYYLDLDGVVVLRDDFLSRVDFSPKREL